MRLFSITINMHNLILLIILLCFYSPLTKSTVVKAHGSLVIENGKLKNQHKKNISLAGPSLYWSNNGWAGENFYSKSVIDNITKLWKASIVRVAIGADAEGGYLSYPKDNLKKAFTAIDAAIENDIYVIIDWHSHHAEDNPKAAIIFFELMAKKYGHLPNIIYEIYNEPLKNTDWHSVIKPYSISVISAIRAIDKDNIILVGSQSWSQDVDIAAKNPITDFNNIAYTLHFYAGTHKEELRAKAQQALDAGLALFVSEWGTVAADGDGDVDYKETEKWLAFMKKNKLSHCSWALSQLDESSAMFKAGASITGKWSDDDLTDNGLYLKKIISQWHIH
jgi:endoglucanase